MNSTKQIAESKNFTAIDFGKLDLVLESANGKIFLKDATKASGTEISISILPPKTDLPIFHSHKQNEETYIILKGEGKFQVDDQCFDISEGSVIRVAPAGLRGMTNTSEQQMIYIVVQSKENSIQQWTSQDGVIQDATPLWK
ncbi:cupin domain-containing protein [Dysgonomonas capnocytophagoides]|uniref:cupin domain-containing protein n=1 Tax=Dysgonomonas capnocytophagoides TaxID=45254 RepID=UPI003340A2C2